MVRYLVQEKGSAGQKNARLICICTCYLRPIQNAAPSAAVSTIMVTPTNVQSVAVAAKGFARIRQAKTMVMNTAMALTRTSFLIWKLWLPRRSGTWERFGLCRRPSSGGLIQEHFVGAAQGLRSAV